MYYSYFTGTPRKEMNGFAFDIKLWPEWKEMVAKSDLDQQKIDTFVENSARGWLDACGYDTKTDHGDGPEPLYRPDHIRVSWGEWGPEHITVPGNACGLDLDEGVFSPLDGKTLSPHNIDCMSQAYLIMLVFNAIADVVITEEEVRRLN